MKGANNTPRTRKAKADMHEGKHIKEKFVEERGAKIIPLVPKTPNQSYYIDLLKTKDIVYAVGSSGSGKTFLACTHAVNELLKGQIERIVLIRPYEFVGRSIGLRPGTGIEKLLPVLQSMLDPIRTVLGDGRFEYALEHDQIMLEALEDCRGRSYRDSIIVVDEASNMDKKAMQTLVTRVDSGSQLIFCGDTASWQKDISSDSGLTWIINLLGKIRKDKPEYLDQDDYEQLYNNIGIVTFTKEDVVRSGISRMFVKIFDEEK